MKPPLGLTVVTAGPDGVDRFRSNGARPGDIPAGLSFRTKRGEGFSDASFTLARRIDSEQADIGLLDAVFIVGEDGSTAYEGRVAAQPRSVGDGHSWSVDCAGWMAHARDRKFREVYVDRNTGAWGDPSVTRKAGLQAVVALFAQWWQSQQGGLYYTYPQTPLGATRTRVELQYQGSDRIPLGELQYIGTFQGATPAGWDEQVLYQTDAATGGGVLVATAAFTASLDGTVRRVSIPAGRTRVSWFTDTNGTAATPAASENRTIAHVAVYGRHGLTGQQVDGQPDGVTAADVIRDVVKRWCPMLNTAGVQNTSWPIPHLVFTDRTDPYDAFTTVNAAHLWELAVWEDRTLHYGPADLTDADWQVRYGEDGVKVDLQGDTTDELANGVAVTFDNLLTGQRDTLTPDDDSDLADPGEGNPVNQHGYPKWMEITLSIPTDPATAAQIGRLALIEHNAPKSPGTIRVQGHIRDGAGHWQQAWKPRANESIAITNFTNDAPRLITETAYTHDPHELVITLEQPTNRIDAVLDRFGIALAAANLS